MGRGHCLLVIGLSALATHVPAHGCGPTGETIPPDEVLTAIGPLGPAPSAGGDVPTVR